MRSLHLPQTPSRSNSPVVSVIIRTCNRSQYLQEALSSIANQSFPLDQIKVIVVDDFSTDNTFQVVQSHRSSLNISYFKHEKNLGGAKAFQTALKQITTKYAMWLDDDDQYSPTMISTCIDTLKSDPSLCAVFTGYEKISADGRLIQSFSPHDCRKKKGIKAICKQYSPQTGILATAGCYRSFHLPSHIPNLQKGQDQFLGLYAMTGGWVRILPHPLYKIRVHSGSHYWHRKKRSPSLRWYRDLIVACRNTDRFPPHIIDMMWLRHIGEKVYHLERNGEKKIGDIIKMCLQVGKYLHQHGHLRCILPQINFLLKRSIPFNTSHWKQAWKIQK